MLASLFEFLRDLAVVAAGGGIAWWCWDQYRSGVSRRDDAARLQLAAERQAVDLKQCLERLDERAAGMAARLEEVAAAERASDLRAVAKARVHRLLQATTDPFLTFAEIERALGQVGRFAGALADEGAEPAEATERLEGDGLRRILIELIADGAIAQLDRDRYFIASDYETGDENDDDQTG